MTPVDGRPDPSLLAHSRAAFTEAKTRRMWHWRLEVIASGLALLTAFIPSGIVAAITALLSLGAKLMARHKATQARALVPPGRTRSSLRLRAAHARVAGRGPRSR